MDGQQVPQKPDLKLFDPESQSPTIQQSSVIGTLATLTAAIIGLAGAVAALAVLALACGFLKWAMFG